MSKTKQQLNVKVHDGVLSITIGIDTLAFVSAFDNEEAYTWDEKKADYCRSFAIADPEVFAEEVCRALRNEDECGNSLLTRLFDQATQEAMEQGADGVWYDEDEAGDLIRLSYQEFHPVETWANEEPE